MANVIFTSRRPCAPPALQFPRIPYTLHPLSPTSSRCAPTTHALSVTAACAPLIPGLLGLTQSYCLRTRRRSFARHLRTNQQYEHLPGPRQRSRRHRAALPMAREASRYQQQTQMDRASLAPQLLPRAAHADYRSCAQIIGSIVGVVVLAAAGVGLGVGLTRKSSSDSSTSSSSSSSSSSTSSDSSDPSDFTKDSALKQVFYGIAYTPEGSQYPDCGNNLTTVIQDIQLLSQLTTVRLTLCDFCPHC